MRRVAWLILLLALLSVVMTYPLAADLAGTVPGPPGDNFEYVYKLWWFEHALFDLNRSPFFVPGVFYPFGYELALSETTLANTILGLPVTAAFGEVVAYNVLALGSFVLSGVGAYLLATQLWRSRTAGFVAGLAFAFLPYRLAHLAAGHLPLMGTGWLPLLLLYEERLLRTRRLRDGALAGFFFAMLALSSWYYAYMGGLLAVLYWLLRARPWRSWLRDGRLWRGVVAGSLVAGALMLPALAPLLSLSARGEMARSTLSLRYVDQWSASLPDFLLPSIMHPLWGEAVMSAYPQNVHESLLFVGFVPLALAIYALRRRRRATGALAAVGVISLVLALGTTLHWAGEPVRLPAPATLVQLFDRAMYTLTGKYALNPAAYSGLAQPGSIVAPLPTLLLYLFLPFFNAMRVWARFGLLVGLVVALLAGAGAAGLAGRGRRTAMTAVLAVALLFEFGTAPFGFGVSAIGAQPVDEWLRAQPGSFAVLALPQSKTWHGPALYAARQSGKSIAYGYGTYMPSAYRAWQKRLADFPGEESMQAIGEVGVRYVLVGLKSYGADEADMRRRLGEQTKLRLVYTAEERPVLQGDRLTRLVAPSAAPTTEYIGDTRYAYLTDEIAVYEVIE